jgi:hypothetical protein
MPVHKSQITQAIIDQLPADSAVSLEFAMNHWWVNIRSSGGLRLTESGYQVLTELEVPSYSVDLDPMKFDRWMILNLDRKMRAPYYIIAKKKIPQRIIMFNSRDAMMASLYGDLEKFLENYR